MIARCLCLFLAGLLGLHAETESPVRPGDRIAFVGNTFADQLRRHGYLETLLLQRSIEKPVTIRNLGWAGDMLTARDRPTNFPTEETTLRAHKLKDGSVHTGVIAHKDEKEIVLYDSAVAGREIRIALDALSNQRPLPSLMPGGLADQLKNRQEFLDLSKFLSVLGRPGSYANDERPFLRKWRVVAGQAGKVPAAEANWRPVYSMVDGMLPSEDLGEEEVVFARGFVKILVSGTMKLELNSSEGLRLWIDGAEVDDLSAPIPATRGRMTLTFAIDRKVRGKTGLRVLLVPADKSVKVQLESGI